VGAEPLEKTEVTPANEQKRESASSALQVIN
jgi:hypothetical protein